VLLKINAKLGGVNAALDERSVQWISERPSMVVRALFV